jgi:hypothetical protein
VIMFLVKENNLVAFSVHLHFFKWHSKDCVEITRRR